MRIVFDTYAWIEYFLDTKKGKIVDKYLLENEIITPSIVLLELSYLSEKQGWSISKVFDFIKLKSSIIGFNNKFILEFGKIYNDAKKRIKGIGIADCIILTMAKLHNAKILTGDKHFKDFDETIFLS